MKIYVSHCKDFDFQKELYAPIRASQLNARHEFFLPHEDGGIANTKKVIKGSDIVLAEVSYPATGQGIELGWADILGVRIVCMHRQDAKIARSLKFISKEIISYTDSGDLIAKLSALL